MIPQRNISLLSNRLAKQGGRRIREDVLERDYCPAWFLTALGGSDLRTALALKGGTAGSGSYRIGILNPNDNRYRFAKVEAARPVKDVKILTKYPVLPVKFQIPGSSKSRFLAQGNDGTLKVFKARIAPGGMSVFEVFLD